MATGILSPAPWLQNFHPTTGEPLSGGLLYTFLAGTSTPTTTWTDIGLLVPNSNPILLDSMGMATIFLSPALSYKYVLTYPATPAPVIPANVIKTQDNITVAGITGTFIPIDASGDGIAFTFAAGEYKKTGGIVLFALRVRYPVTTGKTAGAKIGGLPFPAVAAVDAWGGFLTYNDSTSAYTFLISDGNDFLTVYLAGAGVQNVSLTLHEFRISGFYLTAG